MRPYIVVLALLLWHSAAAETVVVPLQIDPHHLRGLAVQALGLDEQGRGSLVQDACNAVDLAEPRVSADEGRLTLTLDLSAEAGASVLGRCVGTPTWRGQMLMELVPGVEPGGLAVAFRPVAAELRRANGGTGAVTHATRLVAEHLILPRVESMRLDLAPAMAALDELLEAALRGEESLVSRARITSLAVTDQTLQAGLTFEVRRPVHEVTPEAPLTVAEQAAWAVQQDELDGFLTAIIVYLVMQVPQPEARVDLFAVLLDARHEISAVLAGEYETGGDPVRALFARSWDRLRPHLQRLDGEEWLPYEDSLLLAAFLAGGDALMALAALGPEFGLEITADGLRRLARLLLAEDTPLSFTPLPLDINHDLRRRLRLGGTPGANPGSGNIDGGAGWLARLATLLIPAAHAVSPDISASLAGLVPRLSALDEYLERIAGLLDDSAGRHLTGDNRVPQAYAHLFDPLVRATAWKESCWRQFTGTPDDPRVLTSAVGAVGMMQIHVRVWRGLYDPDRLSEDMVYNVQAGIEILEHYLVDYALRHGEQEQAGGEDNLVRATYAAYNGGPSHLNRYRSDTTPARLRAIDNAFWEQFEVIREAGWPEVGSCYPV